MKKVFIITAIVAASAGAYFFSQQQTDNSHYNVLDYVPADTPIFTAQLEPFPLKEYIASSPKLVNPMEQDYFAELQAEDAPKLKFFANLVNSYQLGLLDAELLVKTFGLADELRAYAYTLGLMPVLKIEIENPQAIWDLLDKNELETGFKHTQGTLKSINYRAYRLTEENDSAQIDLIVAIDKGLLTITLNSSLNSETLLATALGLTKVKHSLAESGKIEEIIKKYQFDKSSIGFINHVELIKGITSTDGNQLARQIVTIEKNTGEEDTFSELRSAECAADLSSIAANWPSTVFGYNQVDINIDQSTIHFSAIIESKNNAILQALSALRGYIPEYTADIEHNVFSVALGLDINQLAGSLTDIWSDLQTPIYRCAPLAELQATITESGKSITMLSMGTAMANGVQGVSLALLDYTISRKEGRPSLDKLDAILTLSADDPQMLFNSMKIFTPELQQIQLNNGESVNLNEIFPIPEELNINPKLTIKGKHLIIYNGDKGKQTAEAMASEVLTKNGLYSINLDFKKMFTPIATAAELAGENVPQELRFLIDYDARMKMSFDINQNGLIFDSYINNKAPK